MIKQDKQNVFIATCGWPMNLYDSGLVQSILEKAGYAFVQTDVDAAIVLLNTCTGAKRPTAGCIARRMRFS